MQVARTSHCRGDDRINAAPGDTDVPGPDNRCRIDCGSADRQRAPGTRRAADDSVDRQATRRCERNVASVSRSVAAADRATECDGSTSRLIKVDRGADGGQRRYVNRGGQRIVNVDVARRHVRGNVVGGELHGGRVANAADSVQICGVSGDQAGSVDCPRTVDRHCVVGGSRRSRQCHVAACRRGDSDVLPAASGGDGTSSDCDVAVVGCQSDIAIYGADGCRRDACCRCRQIHVAAGARCGDIGRGDQAGGNNRDGTIGGVNVGQRDRSE